MNAIDEQMSEDLYFFNNVFICCARPNDQTVTY